MQLYRK